MDYRFKAKVLKIIDGDTFDAEVVLLDSKRDLGFHVSRHDIETTTQRFRLTSKAGGINAPERSEPGGASATQALYGMIPPGTVIDIETYKDATGGFGRWLAVVFAGEVEIGKWMVDNGHAAFKTY